MRCHRRRRLASLQLALCAYALVVAPAVHAQHHTTHGADHAHVGEAPGIAPTGEEAHQASHAILDAVMLGDAATAGTVAIDCALAECTLVACIEGSNHAPLFGDALAHHHRKADAGHGRGSLEHLSVSLLGSAPVLLPPPSVRVATHVRALAKDQHLELAPRLHAQRGPPIAIDPLS